MTIYKADPSEKKQTMKTKYILTLFMGMIFICKSCISLHIKIGYIEERTWPNVYGPAVEMAIEDFFTNYEEKGITLNISMEYGFRGCGLVEGTASYIRLKEEHNVDVFIGGGCSRVCIPAGYYLNYWNQAFFPTACVDPQLSDKDVYPTLIRVMPSVDKMANALVEMCLYYNWKQVVLFTQNSNVCEYGARSMMLSLPKINVTIAEWIRTTDDWQSISDNMLRGYLKRIRSRGRIVAACHEPMLLQRLMLLAYDQGMVNSDYVYFFYTLIPFEFTERPWVGQDLASFWDGLAENRTVLTDEMKRRRDAFMSFRTITMADVQPQVFQTFNVQLMKRLEGAPYNAEEVKNLGTRYLPSFLYDATYLYLLVLTELLEEGMDHTDGRLIMDQCRGKIFNGKTGQVFLDDHSDREPNYWVNRYDAAAEKMVPFARVQMSKPPGQRYILEALEEWGTDDGNAPLDIPPCGFQKELCPPDHSGRTTTVAVCVVIVILLMLFLFVSIYFCRKKQLENELLQRLWYVRYEDIDFTKRRAMSNMSLSFKSLHAISGLTSSRPSSGNGEDQVFTLVGLYKEAMVAVRRIKSKGVMLTREDLLEMKAVREMNHENINTFVGACTDPPNICILTLYCPKGSLQDILENDDLKLDWMFKCSLIQDIIKGMAYLHSTKLVSHGNLTSNNCLVDGRWVLKITGYGLKAFCNDSIKDEGEYQKYFKMLWTAPEILRLEDKRPPYGTQKGDVYSFAIILQEIFYRTLPYFFGDMTPKEVIENVKKHQEKPYRPALPESNSIKDTHHGDMIIMMKQCWAEDPDERPSFTALQMHLRKVNKGHNMNIMDNMIAKLEKYASNLEDLVAQRTNELVEEKKKTDSLLYRMLPKVVAERLKQGKVVEAELYEDVTVYFSDIVGFTNLSSESTPFQVVQLLNDLYTMFDTIIDTKDVYKVETIGDAYMVVSGAPKRNGGRHVAVIAEMALDLLQAMTQFQIPHKPNERLQLRIGIHTGPCAAGVVGKTMPRYCLFGDTVNMASRMESNGEALKIHLSSQAKNALIFFPEYILCQRGEIFIKGKGNVTTYWLTGKKNIIEEDTF